LSAVQPNSLISATGTGAVFAAGLWSEVDDPLTLEEETEVIVLDLATGAGLAGAETLTDVGEGEGYFFEEPTVFARETGFERKPDRAVLSPTTPD
jgi:hypothetical protein